MVSYTRSEARDWARERLVGMVNCTIPSFTADLQGINERAIRHDVRLAIEHGFTGTLAVGEVVMSVPEYVQFLSIASDEGRGRLLVVHHACQSTLELNIAAVREAEQTGAELVLLTYPAGFYPESEQEIYDYTKAFCDATDLAVMLFPVFIWGFGPRIHPSDIPARLIRRLLDDCPNIVAIKAEGGMPTIQSAVECERLFGKEVVVSVPLENEMIPLAQVMPIQFSATSDHEFYGPMLPRIFALLRDGKYDDATELYWQLHPARKAKAAQGQTMHGGASLNRLAWKFQGWLQGYNGGSLRQPTQRIHDAQMNALRKGLLDSGLAPSMDPFREFFVGRNPA